MARPDGTRPDGTRPDGTRPNGTKPDGTGPDGTLPEDGGQSLRDIVLANQEVIDELNATLARKTEEIRIIQQTSAELNSTLDLEEVLEIILHSMDAVLGFKHAMVLLAELDAQLLTLAASRGYEDTGIGAEVALGKGVIGVSAKRRRLMRMGNIQSQMAYTKTVRARMEAAGEGENLRETVELPGLPKVQSQIAIPLVVQDRLVGVFAVESETPNAFNELDELLLSIVANQVASAIDNARLHRATVERSEQLDKAVGELSALNESLEASVAKRTAELSHALDDVKQEKELSEALLARMAPPEVIHLMRDDQLVAKKLSTSILFTDLVGFTEFSAGMEADEIFARLNHFFSAAGGVISRYRGYVNKTNGDGLMALFGVPEQSQTHPLDAVLAALRLKADLREEFPLDMRLGINSGLFAAGMLGPANKSLYDVLGDSVNLASRMESVGRPGEITISSNTYDLVKAYFEIEPLGEREVKGLSGIACFEVKGLRALADDGRRVDPTSEFAAMAAEAAKDVEDLKKRDLAMIDFLSIQSRDGAINHNEAVAAYAVALLRHLISSGAALDGLDRVDETQLMRTALLHDVGKHAIGAERLNDPTPSEQDREILRRDLLDNTLKVLDQIAVDGLAAPIEALYRFERQKGAEGEYDVMQEILAAADIYDALTAPKVHKGAPWRISGALQELLHLPYCQGKERPVFEAFVNLMKPRDAAITARTTTKIVFE